MALQQRFQGLAAIVTGGGNGIGTAICERLAREGAHVFVADIDLPAAQMVQQRLRDEGLRATALQVDVCDQTSVMDFYDAMFTIIKETVPQPRLAVLVNNAAAFVFGDVTSVSSEAWDRVLGTNVKGYAFMMKFFIAAFKMRGSHSTSNEHRAIVNLASISSFIAQPDFVPYNTSKGAILQLTRCTALDAAKYGIRVNAVCPGPILTGATAKHAASEGRSLEDCCAEMTSQLIIKRMGQPEEVAAAVAFLASREASFITGTTLMVDGGYTTL